VRPDTERSLYVIFTAGADSDDGADITAMSVLLKHLYGIET
jgi:hypothetical protein